MNEGIRRAIGRLLRRLRVSQGLSLSRVEELTGKLGSRVSRSRLSELERGDVSFQFDDAQVLCLVYGMQLADLFVEALAARPPSLFAEELTAEGLFNEGKSLFDRGRVLEAAWAFDAAAEGAASRAGAMAGLARISASFCYDRLGAGDLALRRVEQALDVVDEESDTFWRAMALMAVLLASRGARVRARVYLQPALAALEAGVSPRLRVFLLDNSAATLHFLGELDQATNLSLEAARLYRRFGEFDLCALKLAAAATCRSEQGRSEQAIRHARDAEGLLADLTRVDTRVFVLATLGKVLAVGGAASMGEAKSCLEEAFRVADLHGLKLRAREIAEVLEQLARREGDCAGERLWKRRVESLPRAVLDGLLDMADRPRSASDSRRTP